MRIGFGNHFCINHMFHILGEFGFVGMSNHWRLANSVQDWSLQCPSNVIWPFKIEYEDVTWSPQYNLSATRTNKRRALSLPNIELDDWFLFLQIVLETSYHSCTSLTWVLYFISIFLDWRLGFERAFQLKGWNLRALQNETHMRASILNTASYLANPFQMIRDKWSLWAKHPRESSSSYTLNIPLSNTIFGNGHGSQSRFNTESIPSFPNRTNDHHTSLPGASACP